MSKSNRKEPKRSSVSESRYTIFEFDREFSDDAACLEYLVQRFYPNGIYCPTCKTTTKHHRETGRPAYACQFCGHHEHPMKGTIFEDSATSLKLWFYAIYLMSTTRCGISAKQLERELGVTYKTAWRMFHLIRKLLADDGSPLSGKVEMDESFFGGKVSNRHLGKRTGHKAHYEGKATAFGMVERGGRVIAKVIPTPARSGDILPHVKRKILPKSMIFTDEARFYDPLTLMGYGHKRVHHSQQVYVDGDAHVNTLEGFWSLVKRGISGVYHSVSEKHLQSYLDEYSFRYNNRDDAWSMFTAFLGRIGKRAA